MMVISSMNLYEFSEKNNREIGILVDAVLDQDIYKEALKEVESIKQSKQAVKESNRSKEPERPFRKPNFHASNENDNTSIKAAAPLRTVTAPNSIQ
jgi:hypothetical protein